MDNKIDRRPVVAIRSRRLFGFSAAAATGLDICVMCVCMPRIPRNWTKTADDPKTTMGRRFAPKRQKRIF